MRHFVAALVVSASNILVSAVTVAQPHCPVGELRAYSHNDYHNPHPLFDAIALGYSGVEVDVFLINGVLRVGHDETAARNGPTLDSAYLTPLRDVMERCRKLAVVGSASTARFLLNIEIKQESQRAYELVTLDLARSREVQAEWDGVPSTQNRVIVTLVGFSGVAGGQLRDAKLGVSCKIENIAEPPRCSGDSRVTMFSVDYGKTMGRWWTLDSQRQRWLAKLKSTKSSHPHEILRVYNVPVSAEIYRELFRSGVDYVGTKSLERSRVALLGR